MEEFILSGRQYVGVYRSELLDARYCSLSVALEIGSQALCGVAVPFVRKCMNRICGEGNLKGVEN